MYRPIRYTRRKRKKKELIQNVLCLLASNIPEALEATNRSAEKPPKTPWHDPGPNVSNGWSVKTSSSYHPPPSQSYYSHNLSPSDGRVRPFPPDI